MNDESTPVAQDLAGFAHACEPRGPIRRAAVRSILDVVGCGLAAVGSDSGREAEQVVAADGGVGESSVLGRAGRLPAGSAAFANGTRFHALDFDDTHEAGICHVSAVVAPAAFAVGEALGKTGSEVVDAYLVGTETALRIAAVAGPGLYARGFHPTSVCGAFGATAATCRLRGLAPATTTNALGIVGSFASGLLEYLSDGSATKPLHAGWASRAGVQAAALAEAGGTGPAAIVDGRFGLLASHSDLQYSSEEITRGLGVEWQTARIAIKPYPACHFLHAVVWGAAEVCRRESLSHADISAIDVRIPREGVALVLEPLPRKREPATPYEAKFSAPFAIAHRLAHGDLGISAFTTDRIRDSRVLSIASRVGGGIWRNGEPPSRFAGALSVTTASGTEHQLEVAHTPGSPDNPMSDEDLEAKFSANASLALDDRAVTELASSLQQMDRDVPVRRILESVRRARPNSGALAV